MNDIKMLVAKNQKRIREEKTSAWINWPTSAGAASKFHSPQTILD